MNQLTRASTTALSTDLLSRLESGIQESRSSTPISGGKPILRLLKSGTWVYGQNDDEVQDGSEWCVNPLSILHGYACWSDYPGNQKNELLGEAMAPVTDPKPAMPGPIKGFPFKEQRQFDLICTLGDDEGVEVVYKTGSVGGMRAVDKFLGEVIAQLRKDPQHIAAVVQLLSDDYQHTKYGQTFVPILEVVGWADMGGNRAEEAPAAPAPQPTENGNGAAAKPAKRAAAAPATAAPVEAAPAPAPAAGAPRRQRPAVVRT